MEIISNNTMESKGVIVTKGASTDGSAMVSYAADSHALYGALYHTPGGKFRAGAMLPVYEYMASHKNA